MVLQVPWCIKTWMIYSIVLGMNYLHTQDPPMIHRDLKPQNLLVTGEFECKVLYIYNYFLHCILPYSDGQKSSKTLIQYEILTCCWCKAWALAQHWATNQIIVKDYASQKTLSIFKGTMNTELWYINLFSFQTVLYFSKMFADTVRLGRTREMEFFPMLTA